MSAKSFGKLRYHSSPNMWFVLKDYLYFNFLLCVYVISNTLSFQTAITLGVLVPVECFAHLLKTHTQVL